MPAAAGGDRDPARPGLPRTPSSTVRSARASSTRSRILTPAAICRGARAGDGSVGGREAHRASTSTTTPRARRTAVDTLLEWADGRDQHYGPSAPHRDSAHVLSSSQPPCGSLMSSSSDAAYSRGTFLITIVRPTGSARWHPACRDRCRGRRPSAAAAATGTFPTIACGLRPRPCRLPHRARQPLIPEKRDRKRSEAHQQQRMAGILARPDAEAGKRHGSHTEASTQSPAGSGTPPICRLRETSTAERR